MRKGVIVALRSHRIECRLASREVTMRRVLFILLVLLSGFAFSQTERQALDAKCASVQKLSDKLLLSLVDVLKTAEASNNLEMMSHTSTFVKSQKTMLVSARNSVCSASSLKAANATWSAAMAKTQRAIEEEEAHNTKPLADAYRQRSASEK
jgi:hypothetical protein